MVERREEGRGRGNRKMRKRNDAEVVGAKSGKGGKKEEKKKE